MKKYFIYLQGLLVFALTIYVVFMLVMRWYLPEDHITFTATKFIPEEHNNECVILMHGYYSRSHHMRNIAKKIGDAGYMTLRINYAWDEYSMDELAKYLNTLAVHECKDRKLHFVGQSLGGIVIRNWLVNYQVEDLGRVVMISPINQGSELFEFTSYLPYFNRVLGPALNAMGTDAEDYPLVIGNDLPEVEIGLIMGKVSSNIFTSFILGGPDDGAVSIEDAGWDKAKESVMLDLTYGELLYADAVAEKVLSFLSKGQFE